jgi:replication-associated recombination protein RarA
VASALHKACRRGNEELAVRCVAEMDLGGYGKYAWRRLRVICSEDVGPAWTGGPAVIEALHRTWIDLRKEKNEAEARLILVHAALLLARARKSRTADHAAWWAYQTDEPLELPDWAFDRHTRRGRRMGRGRQHFEQEAGLILDHDTGELVPATPDDRYMERARRL